VTGAAEASCASGETMISAYCVGSSASPHISTTTGAACEGDGAKTVIACVKN
jgi:hypothetical protein